MDSSSKAAREARQQKLKQQRAQRDAEQKANKERQAKEAAERKDKAERKAKKAKAEGESFVRLFIRLFIRLFNFVIYPFKHIKGALKEEEGSSTAMVVAKTRVSSTFCLRYTIHCLNLTN